MNPRTPHSRSLPTTITFLAMDARPVGHSPPPPPLLKTAILRAEAPPLNFYRYLYDTIGRPYYWVERLTWDENDLSAMLHDEQVYLYILYIGGVPAGMAECDFRRASQAYIAYFGLTPEFIGRRIGPWFLHQVVELCWVQPIARLLVNTCTLDHPRALPTYQRAGFSPYGREERMVIIPANFAAR